MFAQRSVVINSWFAADAPTRLFCSHPFPKERFDLPMANHVSALKRARQTTKKTAVNRSNKTHFRTTLRALREAIHKGDSVAAAAEFRTTVSVIDKSVQKGVIHANTGSRYKSRLNARVKAIGAKPSPAAKSAKKSAAR
jgi:small subunit ribosomal protein S20